MEIIFNDKFCSISDGKMMLYLSPEFAMNKTVQELCEMHSLFMEKYKNILVPIVFSIN